MTTPRSIHLLAATLLVGCHSPTEPPAGLAVAASVRPILAAVGEELRIDVIVSNSSTNEYRVSGSAGGCFAIVDVRDVRGDVVPNASPRVCDLALVQHRVAPSGTLVDKLLFSGVAAGVYRVRARVEVIGYGELPSQDYVVSVRVP